MTKPFAFTAFALALMLGFPWQAHAASDPEFRVAITLRATLDDVIDACGPEPFEGIEEARAFGRRIAPVLGIHEADFGFDPEYDSSCVSIAPRQPLTVPGPLAHQRIFRLSTEGIAAFAVENGFTGLRLLVCVPALPTEIRGGKSAPESSDCEQLGHSFESSGDIELSFRATTGSLIRGLLGSVLYWLIVVAASVAAFRWLARRNSWGVFRRHPYIAWPALYLPAGAAVIVWVVVVAYWTNLVPSLQLLFGLGSITEAVVIGVPALAYGAVAAVLPQARVREWLRLHPDRLSPLPPADEPEIKPLDLGLDPPRFVRLLSMPTFGVVMLAVLLEPLFSNRPTIFFMVTIAALLAFVAPVFYDRFASTMHRAERLRPDRAAPLLQAFEQTGIDVREVWCSPTLIFSLHEPLPHRSRLWTVSSVGTHRLFLWERLLDLPPLVVAGGVLDAGGVSVTTVSGALLLGIASAAQLERENNVVPWLTFLVPFLLIAWRILSDLRRRARWRSAAIVSPHVENVLQGFLLFRRIEARLLSEPRRRARTSLGRRLRGAHQADRYWRASMRLARRFAARAGISSTRFEAILSDTIGMDVIVDSWTRPPLETLLFGDSDTGLTTRPDGTSWYFPNLNEEQLSEFEQRIVRGIRSLLERIEPAGVDPSATTAERDDQKPPALWLTIPNRFQPDYGLEIGIEPLTTIMGLGPLHEHFGYEQATDPEERDATVEETLGFVQAALRGRIEFKITWRGTTPVTTRLYALDDSGNRTRIATKGTIGSFLPIPLKKKRTTIIRVSFIDPPSDSLPLH